MKQLIIITSIFLFSLSAFAVSGVQFACDVQGSRQLQVRGVFNGLSMVIEADTNLRIHDQHYSERLVLRSARARGSVTHDMLNRLGKDSLISVFQVRYTEPDLGTFTYKFAHTSYKSQISGGQFSALLYVFAGATGNQLHTLKCETLGFVNN